MTAAATSKLRKIRLAFPEALEKEAWGDPTFRVEDKIFAMDKHGDGRVSVWFKAPPGSQQVLPPARVGHKGWVGMRVDAEPDWQEFAALVRRSYVLATPKAWQEW